MARPYKSQLEMIRQKALADGCTHAIFWEKWSATMTSVLQDNPTMSSDSQIYKAEKTFFEKHCMYPLPSPRSQLGIFFFYDRNYLSINGEKGMNHSWVRIQV
jgi:hypothetical protein